jgi:hypothetical protein
MKKIILLMLFLSGCKSNYTPYPTEYQIGIYSTIASNGKYNGRWWIAAPKYEQLGFVLGMEECSQEHPAREVTALAVEKLDEFYADGKNLDMSILEAWDKIK